MANGWGLGARTAQAASGASGFLSFLGGYNVCHSVCMALVAGLALIGISVQGLPLAFLVPYAIPLWLIGLGMFGIASWFYLTRKCISRNMMAANAGLLIAGASFRELEPIQPALWAIGFGLAGIAVYNHFAEKGIAKEGKKWCHTQQE